MYVARYGFIMKNKELLTKYSIISICISCDTNHKYCMYCRGLFNTQINIINQLHINKSVNKPNKCS